MRYSETFNCAYQRGDQMEVMQYDNESVYFLVDDGDNHAECKLTVAQAKKLVDFLEEIFDGTE
jgi:hypothetical protein